jgi:pimeloyl-ACP methyl ester carboxylesterase
MLAPLIALGCGCLLAGPAEEFFFDSSGVKIRYLTAGGGEAVVLLHGFAARAEMWDGAKTKLFSDLAKHYRVIAIDCRGHGKSGKPHDPKLYGKEMWGDVVRLLDHLKIEKAHVIGYSMGAEIAGHLLVEHPDRLLSVTLAGGVPSFEPTKESLHVKELAATSLEEDKGIGAALIAGTPAGSPKPTPEMANAISRAIIGNQDQKALAASVRGAKDLHVTEAQLKANRVPCLVVYGSKDGQAAVRARYDRVAKLLGAQVQVIDGGDHGSTYGMPAFLEAVRVFLETTRRQ